MPDNPFNSGSAARRYAAGRKYYHDRALDLAFAQLDLPRVGLAVDVGCGTGLSTRALQARADRVIAFDISSAMLSQAHNDPLTHYVLAEAERVPLRTATADLFTVGAAFHWLDHHKVLSEAARVLRDGGALVVYSDFFLGQLEGVPEFVEWFANSYLPRYPTPRRNAHFNGPAAAAMGFAEVVRSEAEIVIPFNEWQLADFLLSQSNATVAIESGATTSERLRSDLLQELSPFFPDADPVGAAFGIKVWTTVLDRT